MKRSLLCVALIAVLALCGCRFKSKCYELEITPDGDGFQRKLTCKRQSPTGAKQTVLQGRFTDTIPADVGGAGTYLHFASSLGDAYSYIERLRGSDDVQTLLENRRAAVDKLIDVLLGWLESELGNEPNFQQLRSFVDKEVRHDIVNLGLLLWTAEAVGYDDETETELVVRTGQYLREHGYFSPSDVPALARAMVSDDADPLLRHLQSLAARKLGIPDDRPVPKSLDFLSDQKRAEESWSRYVRTTEAFHKATAKWRKEKAQNPDAKPPTPDSVLGDVLGDALMELLSIRFLADFLKVKLHCRQEPHDTNGDWDAETGTVNWSKDLFENPSLPVICYALWSVPDRQSQRSHFGKTIFAGEELTGYVLWYRGLSGEETKQWDQLIADCKPGEKLTEQIRAFRFRGDPQPDPDNPDQILPSLADTPRRLLLDALQPDPEAEEEPEGENEE